MSEIPPDQLCYREVVAEYFLALRGSGLMLSPLDAQQVAEWEQRGVPVAVVCRGLRRGFEEHAEGRPASAARPRSLRALRGAVESEWRGYRSGRVGDAPAPPTEASAVAGRVAAARALLAGAARGPSERMAAAYAAGARALEARIAAGATTLDDVEQALADADRALLAAWLGSLARTERAALGRRIALRAGGRRRASPRRAHRETLRAHLLEAAREAGLLPLRGTV